MTSAYAANAELATYSSYPEEEECYAQYDSEVANAIAEADYQDFYYCQDPDQDQGQSNDALLSLVVDVQNYLIEQADNSSALYHLQYKMYTYLRQKANELGV